MGGAEANHEVEIKLRVADRRSMRAALKRAGFRVERPRVFEANVVFDKPDLSLRRQGKLLRVREAGGQVFLTYKGLSFPGKHKRREEIEVQCSEGGALTSILERLGMTATFRYEKYRTEYRQPGSVGIVTLDETPIGDFLELEGPPAWIDSTAAQLGFSEAEYITASYGRLFQEHTATCADPPVDMVFARGQKRIGA